MQKTIDILYHVFPKLKQDEITQLLEVSEWHTYAPDIVLCQEGNIEDTFYIIISGEVEIHKNMGGQYPQVLSTLGQGEFFGELALLEEGPRTASVKTLTALEVLEIHRDAFVEVLNHSAAMAVQIMRQVAQLLRKSDQRAIAKLQQKNAELAVAYVELEAQQKLRSEFLTTISHELRTPLTAASGYLQLITSNRLNKEQTEAFINTTSQNLKTVIHLVNNILFLQELDMIKPEFELLHLEAVVMEAIQSVMEKASKSGITITTRTESGIPFIDGDITGLSRAIQALLDNAIKFSPDGGEIMVHLHIVDKTLHLDITDPGIGFPMERQVELFKPFTRIETAKGHLFGGVGLGLPIAKHVVELHNGHIQVQSEEDKGSTFTIVLPIEDRLQKS